MSLISNELQNYLRQFELLRNVQCGYATPEREMVAPFLVTISGWIYINGEPKFYETEVDIREFTSGADLERLVKVMHLSFDEATRRESSTH